MWILLIIIFSQPYHVSTVDILGAYTGKTACVNAQKRAMTIPVPRQTSFGCVKIEGVKTILQGRSNVSNKTVILEDSDWYYDEVKSFIPIEDHKKLKDKLWDKGVEIRSLRAQVSNLKMETKLLKEELKYG